jgi:hypothetical protein
VNIRQNTTVDTENSTLLVCEHPTSVSLIIIASAEDRMAGKPDHDVNIQLYPNELPILRKLLAKLELLETERAAA